MAIYYKCTYFELINFVFNIFSYGGMLTAYMRYKYPHIIDGGVASSAPFMTIAGNRPRSEFFETVTRVRIEIYYQSIYCQLFSKFVMTSHGNHGNISISFLLLSFGATFIPSYQI
jgi:Serine carboxypeptidase S28.